MEIKEQITVRCVGGAKMEVKLLKSRHIDPSWYIDVSCGRHYLQKLILGRCGYGIAKTRFDKLVKKWLAVANEQDIYSIKRV